MEDVKTIKIPMMGCDEPMPYPHRGEFERLKLYGETIAELINRKMKG
jgi:hypothetical protein